MGYWSRDRPRDRCCVRAELGVRRRRRYHRNRISRRGVVKAREGGCPTMNLLINALIRLGLLREDLDYHYEAQVLVPYIGNGPLLFWMYPVFGIRGASWVLGVSEWSFALLLFLGFWHKRLGILGALGSCAAFIGTVTIIPFMPDGWAASAGGFPAMTGNVPFLMKDVVLFAASLYLLKQDVARVAASAPQTELVLERAGLRATR